MPHGWRSARPTSLGVTWRTSFRTTASWSSTGRKYTHAVQYISFAAAALTSTKELESHSRSPLARPFPGYIHSCNPAHTPLISFSFLFCRQRRLRELQEAARRPRFGAVELIRGSEFVQKVGKCGGSAGLSSTQSHLKPSPSHLRLYSLW